MSKELQPPAADKCTNYRRLSKTELDQCLNTLLAEPPTSTQATELQQLLHELHVHQIELGIQNRALCEAQIELEEAYDRYADLYDFAPVGYLTLSAKGNILEVNLRGAAMLGRECSQLTGKPLMPFLARDESRTLFEHLTQAFQTTTRKVHELQLKPIDGISRTVRIESIAVLDNDGTPKYCHSALIDITRQQQADLALRTEHALTQCYLDTIETIIVVLNKEGQITLINRKGCELFGCSEKELMGKNWFDFCLAPSEDAESHFNTFKAIMAGRQECIKYHETYVIDRFQEEHLIAWHNSCLHDSTGNITGALRAGEDITERKQTESLLEGQRMALELMARGASLDKVLESLVVTAESLTQNICCSVMLLDEEHKYLRFGAAPNLPNNSLDTTRKEEVPIDGIACGEAAQDGKRIIIKDIQNTPSCKPCYEIANKAGIHACWAEPITSSSSKVLGLFITYHTKEWNPTTTELRSTESLARLAGIAIERRQSKALAQQHQAELTHMARINIMGEMATGLAHELNQPLAAITTFTGAAVRMLQAGTTNPDKLNEALQGAHDQAMRASEIIRHTRQLIQKRAPQKKQTDLKALIKQAIEFIQFEAHAKGIRFETKLEANLPLATIDSIQIEQVLLNLLRNAIDATPYTKHKHQTVTIQADLNSEGWIQISVTDKGCGMSEETLSHLFKPFSTTKGAAGMGMGLSICRTIMEDHDGRLWAESELGHGSSFYLTLPLTTNHQMRWG